MISAMPKKPRIGRPRKPKGEKYATPNRFLGRVDDETWATLQAAAQAAGKTFTAWAVAILKRAAGRK